MTTAPERYVKGLPSFYSSRQTNSAGGSKSCILQCWLAQSGNQSNQPEGGLREREAREMSMSQTC